MLPQRPLESNPTAHCHSLDNLSYCWLFLLTYLNLPFPSRLLPGIPSHVNHLLPGPCSKFSFGWRRCKPLPAVCQLPWYALSHACFSTPGRQDYRSPTNACSPLLRHSCTLIVRTAASLAYSVMQTPVHTNMWPTTGQRV